MGPDFFKKFKALARERSPIPFPSWLNVFDMHSQRDAHAKSHRTASKLLNKTVLPLTGWPGDRIVGRKSGVTAPADIVHVHDYNLY